MNNLEIIIEHLDDLRCEVDNPNLEDCLKDLCAALTIIEGELVYLNRSLEDSK